ncbi:hypothetical protein AAKU67_001304 [Oxalobacteraceae bacterium GrIS 2.11]
MVASEVRNLAQRSASAAKEIKTLIDDSVDKVRLGSNLVDQAGSTMDEIVTSIKNVTDIMSEITTAGLEQSAGIEQISNAINQLDKATQQNSLLVEKSVHATQGLEGKANDMIAVVQLFKLDHSNDGAKGAPIINQIAGPRGTSKEAIALVQRAVEFRKTVARRDAFLAGVTDPANKFFDRDMYVFALDTGGKYVAFGGDPAKVGKRLQDVPGVDGKRLLADIIEQCQTGPGWVNYDIFNAATNKVQSKRSYVVEIDDVYIGCGVYTSLA